MAAPTFGSRQRDEWDRERFANRRARINRGSFERTRLMSWRESERHIDSAHQAGRLNAAGQIVDVPDSFAQWAETVSGSILAGRKSLDSYASATLGKRLVAVCEAIGNVPDSAEWSAEIGRRSGYASEAIATVLDIADQRDDLAGKSRQAHWDGDVSDAMRDLARDLTDAWLDVLVAPDDDYQDPRDAEIAELRSTLASVAGRIDQLEHFE